MSILSIGRSRTNSNDYDLQNLQIQSQGSNILGKPNIRILTNKSINRIERPIFMKKGSKYKITKGNLLFIKINSRLNINMYMKLKKYYKIVIKEMYKETLDKINRHSKIIVILEMLILEIDKMVNQITIGIIEVIEDISLDQIIKVIKITVDSSMGIPAQQCS